MPRRRLRRIRKMSRRSLGNFRDCAGGSKSRAVVLPAALPDRTVLPIVRVVLRWRPGAHRWASTGLRRTPRDRASQASRAAQAGSGTVAAMPAAMPSQAGPHEARRNGRGRARIHRAAAGDPVAAHPEMSAPDEPRGRAGHPPRAAASRRIRIGRRRTPRVAVPDPVSATAVTTATTPEPPPPRGPVAARLQPAAQVRAAWLGLAAPLRTRPALLMTRVRALRGPRRSQNVTVALLPSLLPS